MVKSWLLLKLQCSYQFWWYRPVFRVTEKFEDEIGNFIVVSFWIQISEDFVYPVLFRSGRVQVWGSAHVLWQETRELPQVQKASQGVAAFVWHPPQVQRRHDRRHTAGLPVLCPHWWLCLCHGQKKTEDCHQHNERRGWVRFFSVLQTRTGSLPPLVALLLPW